MQLSSDGASLVSILPLATAALVPGWVWVRVERRVWLRCKAVWQEDLFHYGIYSLVLYVALFLAHPVAADFLSQLENNTAIAAAAVGFALIPFAVAGGVFTGICGKKDVLGWILKNWLGIHVASSVEMGWQAAFQRAKGCVVRVRYKCGRETYAVFNPKSVIPEPGSNSDAYFEKTFVEDRDGNLVPALADGGVWIKMSEVQEIRIYDYEQLKAAAKCQVGLAKDDPDGVATPESDQRWSDSVATSENFPAADLQSLQSRAVEVKTA